MNNTPKEILDTMLGYLGFVFEIKEIENERGLTLQVYCNESQKLIGNNGEILEDIQYLLNRALQTRDRNSPRIYVDVEHFRDMRDDALLQKTRQTAEIVRSTGHPTQLDPMNAYERRIVHNAFKDDPEIMTWSPPDDERIKQITIKKRTAPGSE